MLSEELIEEGIGAKYGDTIIPSLLLVDDVAIIADNRQDMQKMLRIVEDFRKRYRPECQKIPNYDCKWERGR